MPSLKRLYNTADKQALEKLYLSAAHSVTARFGRRSRYVVQLLFCCCCNLFKVAIECVYCYN